MSTSEHTIEQVRSILSKLDRDIDAARERRLQTGRVSVSETQIITEEATLDEPHADDDPGRSGYGKARPLRRQHID